MAFCNSFFLFSLVKEPPGFYFTFSIFLLFSPQIINFRVLFFEVVLQLCTCSMHILYHLSEVQDLDIPWEAFLSLWFIPSSLKSSDKCGKLPLSPKQKAMFAKWVRPDDITNNPTMIYTVSSFSIKQVSCSQREMYAVRVDCRECETL